MIKFTSSLAIGILLISCATKEETGLYLPDDLEATLWAESPLFFNPTNMDVDLQGRIWITEAVNYRNFNNDSLHNLHFAKGDRVMILEDTNDDGVADLSKVFVQDKDLVSPLGIAVLDNKIFVSCSPNLIVYTDENGDDVPDKKEIFLTGFGGMDHDHSLHSVVGGPDGNIYFNTGNAGPHLVRDRSGWMLRSGSIYTGGTPYNLDNKGNMKSDDGRVWVGGLALRITPEGTGLKVLAHNFRNSYEVAIDSHGNLWQNDNDDQVVACRTSWIMRGGNAGYFSDDGTRYWQADQRPWQDTYTAHWHQQDPGVMPAGDKTGAGSPTGVVVYESDALGEKYQGMLLSADAGRNIIFSYLPVIKQSGYDLGARTNLISSLSIDTISYVWNDTSHVRKKQNWFRPSDVAVGTEGAVYVADWYDPIVGGHQMKDSLGYGRIYRITPKNKQLIRPKIDFVSTEGLLNALKSPAINVRYAAFNKLKSKGNVVLNDLRVLLADANPFIRSRATYLMAQLSNEGEQEVMRLLEDENEQVRAVALRALGSSDSMLTIVGTLSSDPSPFVRREVAVMLADFQFDEIKPIINNLIKQVDGTDKWMVETIGALCEGHEAELYLDLKKMFDAKEPTAWNDKLAMLMWRLHPPQAVNDFKTRIQSSALSADQKDLMFTALGFTNSAAAAKAMLGLSKSSDQSISEKAMYWLAFRQSNDWYDLLDWGTAGIDLERERTVATMRVKQTKLLEAHQSFDERKWNAQDMARNAVGGQLLVNLMATKELPNDMVPVVEALIFQNPDLSVRIQASSYFKRNASENWDLGKMVSQHGNPEIGKSLFEQNCSTCHSVRLTGHDIGPDLTFVNKKLDKLTLMDAIVNPSGGIVFGYEPWLLNMKNGDSYFGFLLADGVDLVVLKDITGKKWNLPTTNIAARKKQSKSLMPEPGDLNLKSDELVDIVEYLLTLN